MAKGKKSNRSKPGDIWTPGDYPYGAYPDTQQWFAGRRGESKVERMRQQRQLTNTIKTGYKNRPGGRVEDPIGSTRFQLQMFAARGTSDPNFETTKAAKAFLKTYGIKQTERKASGKKRK